MFSITLYSFLLVLLIAHPFTPFTMISGASVPSRLVMKLIHRESPNSPYRTQNISETERVRHMMSGSGWLLAHSMMLTGDEADIRAAIIPSLDSPSLFFVNFSVGEPPVPQHAFMDTGSNLLWVQCIPCDGCHEDTDSSSLFDPYVSCTFKNISCDSFFCRAAPFPECVDDRCQYTQWYADSSSSNGVLVLEQITFETSDDGITKIQDVVLGCGHMNRWASANRDHRRTGIFGLGGEMPSIVGAFEGKFSYCIGDVLNPNYTHNQLILGHGSVLEGPSTRLIISYGNYFVRLEGISFGDKLLDILKGTFDGFGTEGGVAIDSGTQPLHLAPGAFSPVVKAVDDFLSPKLSKSPLYIGEDGLCYLGNVSMDLNDFPRMTIHFREGAKWVLEPGNLFYQRTRDTLCLGVVRNTYFSVIGMLAQRFYNIGYDVQAEKLYFHKMDCTFLDDD